VAVGNAGKDVDVLVRPEALALAPEHGANGIVSAVTFRGAQTRVDVLLWADMAVKVDVPSSQGATLAPGASVKVTLASDNVLVDGKVGDISLRLEEA
jgi:putative spermidine/putrescine transport system ATP-binding protein